MASAFLKSVVGDYTASIGLPTGKKFEVRWNKGNNFIAEVPVELRYRDDFNRIRVAHPNWAQHLLNSYPKDLKLVRLVETPVVQAPLVVEPKEEVVTEDVVIMNPVEPVILGEPEKRKPKKIQEPVLQS